jgi:hypothetical protein
VGLDDLQVVPTRSQKIATPKEPNEYPPGEVYLEEYASIGEPISDDMFQIV